MNKKEVNEKLKNLGFGFVKMAVNKRDSVLFNNYEGKRFKGIKGGSIGPMTMTDAHMYHNREIEQEIQDTFGSSFSRIGNELRIEYDEKGKTKFMKLEWRRFPSNHSSRDLDPGYQTYWLVDPKIFGTKY